MALEKHAYPALSRLWVMFDGYIRDHRQVDVCSAHKRRAGAELEALVTGSGRSSTGSNKVVGGDAP